jgi:hypothetical protein
MRDFRARIAEARDTSAGPERTLNTHKAGNTPGLAPAEFGAGLDDLLILPLVVAALAVKAVLQAALVVVIHILDYAFPILLQLVRFPLFTVRIIGDGVVALLTRAVDYVPASAAGRDAWRQTVRQQWARLRQTISYQAFEQGLHHAFEGGMAWVFAKCRTLSPNTAFLVIIGALFWLPISFGVATGMHAILIAKAAALPAWMQLLHPVATIIAKSKLLVLPVYPAAWPQAKKHPFVQASIRFYQHLTTLRLMRKVGHRYQRTRRAAGRIARATERAATRAGLVDVLNMLFAGLGAFMAWIGWAARTVVMRVIAALSNAPLVGPIVRSYAAHYGRRERTDREKMSQKVSRLLAYWSVNLSAEYYEERERQRAAQDQGGA